MLRVFWKPETTGQMMECLMLLCPLLTYQQRTWFPPGCAPESVNEVTWSRLEESTDHALGIETAIVG